MDSENAKGRRLPWILNRENGSRVEVNCLRLKEKLPPTRGQEGRGSPCSRSSDLTTMSCSYSTGRCAPRLPPATAHGNKDTHPTSTTGSHQQFLGSHGKKTSNCLKVHTCSKTALLLIQICTGTNHTPHVHRYVHVCTHTRTRTRESPLQRSYVFTY